ncbi:MAG: metal ABC transporter substrate-binding protein [Chloroflexi bacterium]|nr:metal ABC transporter substrate-binding protein [Chloroflexota bacterium]
MLNVVASQSILTDVARQVAGDRAEVRSLIPVGSDPHAFTPSPSDLTDVAEADLVFIVGTGYEESLLQAIENAGEMVNIVVASACVRVIPAGASMHHDDEHADEHDDHAHEEDDDHAHEEDDEHAHEEDDDHAHEEDDDHAHEEDDDHAHEEDDDHAHEEDDDHAHEEDDDHAHEEDDDHAHEEDDDHAHEEDDDHAHEEDDDHAHEEDDDHAHEEDDDHAHEHDDDHAHDMNGASDCDAHDAEVAAFIGEESAERGHVETLGREGDIDCGGGHDHGHEDEHGHGHGICDPHMWMDPHNVMYWVLQIRDALAAQDPDNADVYAANAAAYNQELLALESDFILPALMDLPVEERVLVTSHEAFGYLATTYRFELIFTLAGISTMVEPSAQDVAALIDVVRDEGIPAVFGDPFAPQPIMSAIVSETGVELVKLFSDTLSDEAGPAATYLDYMRYNVKSVIDALSGGE